MASVTAAVSALATFAGAVSGITHSYDISATPDKLLPSQLPACVIVFDKPVTLATRALIGNQTQYNFNIVQLCLVSQAGNQQYKRGMAQVLPILDAFLLAYKATPFLTTLVPGVPGPVHQPVTVTATTGEYTYGDTPYYGIEFVVSMMLNM